MEQSGGKWTSSLLKELGASAVTVPATNPTSKIKQYAAALSLAAVAAMASFAPSVSHAAQAPSAAPIELAATYVYPDDVPEPEAATFNEAAFEQARLEADNPYTQEYKIPPRERDGLDTINDVFNMAQGTVDKNAEVAETMPLFNNPVYKAYEAVTSPLDMLVKHTTDKSSTANEYAQKAADITNMAVKYSTVGAAALVSDGISGVGAGVGKIAEMRDKDHEKAQAAVDASRERMARIYNEERARMVAESAAAKGVDVANRVDVQKADSGGLETSHEGMDVLFNAEPAKAGKYDHDNSLSR